MQPSYDAPRRKSNTGLIIGLILGGVGLCCVLPLIGVTVLGLWGVNKVKGPMACTMAFSDLYVAFKDYAVDHKGLLPQASKWQMEVLPYYSKVLAKQQDRGPFAAMSGKEAFACQNENGVNTGIAFNLALSGKNIDTLKSPATTPLLFETDAPKLNASEVFKKREPGTGPVYIMGQRRNWIVLYADGTLDAKDSTGKPLPVITAGGRIGR